MTIHANRQQLVAWLLASLILLPSCSSSILISSTPSQADVYANGQYIGQTPVRHRDSEIGGSILDLEIEKEGYEVHTVGVVKKGRINLWALMGCWMLFPLAWLEMYPKRYAARLQPMTKENSPLRVEVQTRETVGSNVFVVVLENAPCQGSPSTSVLEASVGIRLMEKYQVLERQALDVVSSEQRRNMTWLHDEASIVDAGKLSGARGVVLVSRLCDRKSTLTSMRFVDCESGALHWAVLAKNQTLDTMVDALYQDLDP